MSLHAARRSGIGTSAILLLALFSAPLAAGEVALPTETLQIARGRITFRIEAYMSKTRFKSIEGRGGSLSGRIDPAAKTMEIRADVRDFTTDDRQRDADMHKEVLDSAAHPVVEFRGRIESYDPATGKTRAAAGTLSLRGRKREVRIQGKLEKYKDNDFLLSADFSVNLPDFEIKPPSNLFVLRVGDTVQVSVQLRLTRGGK